MSAFGPDDHCEPRPRVIAAAANSTNEALTYPIRAPVVPVPEMFSNFWSVIMKSIYRRVTEFLSAHDISFSEKPGGSIIVLARLRHGLLITQIQVDPEINHIRIGTLVPVEVPEERRAAVAEFAMAFHMSIRIGRFQFDLDDRELQFVTSAMLGNTSPDDELLMHLLVGNHLTTDSAIPAINAVANHSKSPAEALEEFHAAMQELDRTANARAGARVQPGRTRSMFGSGDQLSSN
jgi:hypothetical protein